MQSFLLVTVTLLIKPMMLSRIQLLALLKSDIDMQLCPESTYEQVENTQAYPDSLNDGWVLYFYFHLESNRHVSPQLSGHNSIITCIETNEICLVHVYLLWFQSTSAFSTILCKMYRAFSLSKTSKITNRIPKKKISETKGKKHFFSHLTNASTCRYFNI